MSSSFYTNNSFLKLNKEELKIKKPKRRETNYLNSLKRLNPYNEISPKRLGRLSAKFKNIKSKSLIIQKNNNKESLKIKEKNIKPIRHITSKDLIQRKYMINRNSLTKETIFNSKTIENNSNKISNKIVIDLNKEKMDNLNLKKVESKIFVAINRLKNNYQNDILIDEEILNNNKINTNYNDNINNNLKNISFNNNNITRNSLFKKKKNENEDAFNSNNNSSYNNSKIKINNSFLNKDKNNNFLNSSDYNILNKIIIKKDKIRNIRRIKQLYDSFDDDESEKDNDDFHGYIISPKSSVILFFDLFIFLSSIYYLIYIPLRMAKINCFCSNENEIHLSILYIIDILFICDLCLSFFRGYYNYQFKFIRNNKKIFFNYLKTDFLFDLIEAIPIFTYSNFFCVKKLEVNYCFSNDMSNSLILLKIITSFKIMKIFKVKNKQKNESLNCFFNLFSENFSLEKIIDNCIDFFLCFLAFHFFVCLNIFISKHTYPNWINIMQLQDKPLIYIYLCSFYSLIETLTTVGYGDVVCQCGVERIYQIIILGVGVIAYSYLISAFGNLIKNESESSIKYNNSMKILEAIRIDYPNMSFKLYNKIYNHIESKNVSQKKLDANFLINSLPFNLKNFLLLIMYDSIIKNFKFFQKCENSNFIIQVLSKFVPSTNKKSEFVLFEGEMIEEIIFVKDGRLSLEAAIDMGDQEYSIKKYFNINFRGINSEKDNKKLEDIKYNSKPINSRKSKDFDNVKFVLNNAVKKQVNCLLNEDYDEMSILDKTKLDKKQIVYNNYYGTDILKNEPIKNEEGNYKYIKILDIRKNENFGGLYMFLRRPSPLSLKVRSKFAELYLLPKKEVFTIAKSFSNIWRKIHKNDFHNMVSIKHQTFNILNKYIEINGIERIDPIDISRQYFLDEARKFKPFEKNLIINNNKCLYSPTHYKKIDSNNFNKKKHKLSTSSKNLKACNNFKNELISHNLKLNELSKTQIINIKNIKELENLNNRIINKKSNSINENNNKDKFEKNSEKNKEDNVNNCTQQNLKIKTNKITEISEEKEKSKKKENKRKLFLFGKQTAELIRIKVLQ